MGPAGCNQWRFGRSGLGAIGGARPAVGAFGGGHRWVQSVAPRPPSSRVWVHPVAAVAGCNRWRFLRSRLGAIGGGRRAGERVLSVAPRPRRGHPWVQSVARDPGSEVGAFSGAARAGEVGAISGAARAGGARGALRSCCQRPPDRAARGRRCGDESGNLSVGINGPVGHRHDVAQRHRKHPEILGAIGGDSGASGGGSGCNGWRRRVQSVAGAAAAAPSDRHAGAEAALWSTAPPVVLPVALPVHYLLPKVSTERIGTAFDVVA